MLSPSPIAAGRNRVLGSVFCPASDHFSLPTALSLELKALNQSSGPSNLHARRSTNRPSDASTIDDSLEDRETWDRAWNIATAALSLPDKGFPPVPDRRDPKEEHCSELLKQWSPHEPSSKETEDALAYVVAPLSREGVDRGQDNILTWYKAEMRRHFVKNLRDGLGEVCGFREVCLTCLIGIVVESSGERATVADYHILPGDRTEYVPFSNRGVCSALPWRGREGEGSRCIQAKFPYDGLVRFAVA